MGFNGGFKGLICFVFKTEIYSLSAIPPDLPFAIECPPPLASPNCMFIND
jgi:hypothetical protein